MVEPYYAQTSTISYVKLEGLFNRAALNYENFILWVIFKIIAKKNMVFQSKMLITFLNRQEKLA